MERFLSRHAEKITGKLHCLDRVIFHGHLPANYPESLYRFLRERGVAMEQFGKFVQEHSTRLREAAEAYAAREGRPCEYMKKPGRKEEWARKIAERDGVTEGLVAILRTTENCRSFSIRQFRRGPRLVSAPRRCLHLYFYFIDPKLGWMHARLQTWFPFLIQIGINGHEILARQMERAGIDYVAHENGFLRIADLQRARKFAQRQCGWNWVSILDRIARRVNPLLGDILKPMSYRWVIDQCEMSTDILFEDSNALGKLYSKLVEHAALCFTAEDILGFFGRRVHGLFSGEVFNECKTRHWGVRIKHRVGQNWVKMYNKGGSILRVETVIDRPQDIRIRRKLHPRKGEPYMGVGPLPKSVAYFQRYWEIQLRANRHYLRALAIVEDPSEAYSDLKQLGSRQKRGKQRHRALNPLAENDRNLLAAVMRGEHHLHGFRNQDILRILYGDPPTNPRERKRLSARVRRQLLTLRAHGLIRRVGRSRRNRVTERGMRLCSASLHYAQKDLPERLMYAA